MPAGKSSVDQQCVPEFGADHGCFFQVVENILFFAGEHSRQFGICEPRIVHFRFDEFVGFRMLLFHFCQEANCFGEGAEDFLPDSELQRIRIRLLIGGMHDLKVPELRRIGPVLRLRHRILLCPACCAGGLRIGCVFYNFLSAVVTSEHKIAPFDFCGCSFCLEASNKNR